MGDKDYLYYMIDHGGNATPVWISVAHFLFSALPTSMGAFGLTALLDPLLFALTFAAIWRCFGYRTAAVVMVVFGANDFVMYGTNWGGATLRHDWLMLTQSAGELFGDAPDCALISALRNLTRAKFRHAMQVVTNTRALLLAKPAIAHRSGVSAELSGAGARRKPVPSSGDVGSAAVA